LLASLEGAAELAGIDVRGVQRTWTEVDIESRRLGRSRLERPAPRGRQAHLHATLDIETVGSGRGTNASRILRLAQLCLRLAKLIPRRAAPKAGVGLRLSPPPLSLTKFTARLSPKDVVEGGRFRWRSGRNAA
jgi:hypothetical protein